MYSWLRRLWIRFELWNNHYCTEHGIERQFKSLDDKLHCAGCDQEATAEAARLQQEREDRLESYARELQAWKNRSKN